MALHRIIDHCTPPAPPAQQKIPPGVRPRRDGRVRGYSNSRARCFASDFCVDISPVFGRFFAYRLRNCLFSCTDGVKWESFFHSSQSKNPAVLLLRPPARFSFSSFSSILGKNKIAAIFLCFLNYGVQFRTTNNP